MARHFFRLKLALIVNSLRASWQQRLGLLFGVVFTLPLALAGFLLLLLAERSEDHADAIVVAAFVLLFVGWVVLPVLGFASDQTLDPARLSLLPLTRRRLVAGLFVASSLGVAPLATLVVLAGAVLGFVPAGPGALLVVAAAVVQFALCIVGSRAVTTLLAGVLRTRRGRDVVVILAAVLGVAVAVVWNTFIYVANARETVRGLDFAPLLDVLAWLPPGLAGRALVDAGSGDLPRAGFELALAALAAGLLAWVWSSALVRALTTAGGSGRKRTESKSRLFPRFAGFLPRDRRGAVAAKDIRYWTRDPRLRATWISMLAFAIAPVAVILVAGVFRRPEAVLLAPVFLWFTSLYALNQFGVDGPATWMNVVAAGDIREDILGKNVALSLLMLPLVALVATVVAAVTGGWVYLPVAIGVAVGVLGAALGLGNVASVRAPMAAPQSATNPWATAGAGTGSYVMLVQLVALMVLNVLLFPIVVGVIVGLVVGPLVLAAVAALAVPYGWGLWRLGLLLADEYVRSREPELLAALTPTRQ